ncbi:MAG: rRNA maturation RNase YbeY [Thiotrichaceae bacterium]|nr:rRNA maturation RNase YbeY [Thiotrichaceae bacterium]
MIESATIPDNELLVKWIKTGLIEEARQHNTILSAEQEVTLRIVDKEEIRSLNKTYRHHDKTTNVLSFPFEIPAQLPADMPFALLGDIVVCHAIVVEQALQQHKELMAHWAHMVIHGVLHLKGYDHIQDSEADIMETLEIQILEQLGFSNPY